MGNILSLDAEMWCCNLENQWLDLWLLLWRLSLQNISFTVMNDFTPDKEQDENKCKLLIIQILKGNLFVYF